MRLCQHPRRGITLTEILISIFIMGIGMVSVATLFPIGLMRMRDATRFSRSTLLAESAFDEIAARNLLDARSFVHPNVPWYPELQAFNRNNPGLPLLTPFNKDINRVGNEANNPGVIARDFQAGLPVAYDPLFWSTVHFNTFFENPPQRPDTAEWRFGWGLGAIRPAGNSPPPAHGLQRVTNFTPYNNAVDWDLTYTLPNTAQNTSPVIAALGELAGDVFTSPDDPVLTDSEAPDADSPLIPADFDPDPNSVAFQRDYAFSWMATARQLTGGESSTYEVDIVSFQHRPIGLEPITWPVSGNDGLWPAGERVVEAVWGHTSSPASVEPLPNAPNFGYSSADERVVLLRWHVNSPDPNVRVGSWIADVTYERFENSDINNVYKGAVHPGQRMHWYRVAQRSQPEPDPQFPEFRRMIVRVESPLEAKTLLTNNGGVATPVFPEAALLHPYVANVFSKLVFIHGD